MTWLEWNGEQYRPDGVWECAVEPVSPLPEYADALIVCSCARRYLVYNGNCFVWVSDGGFAYGQEYECVDCGGNLNDVLHGRARQLALEIA